LTIVGRTIWLNTQVFFIIAKKKPPENRWSVRNIYLAGSLKRPAIRLKSALIKNILQLKQQNNDKKYIYKFIINFK